MRFGVRMTLSRILLWSIGWPFNVRVGSPFGGSVAMIANWRGIAVKSCVGG